jgi:hypothetical protein
MLAINDDIPREDFWNVSQHILILICSFTFFQKNVHNLKIPGTTRHFIATVEQLFKTPEAVSE